MQFSRYIALRKSSLPYQKMFLTFRLVLLVGITIYLWQNLATNRDILFSLGTINYHWQLVDFLLLLITFFLLPVNWLLEAKKWQIIAGDNNLNINHALRGVVLGLTLDNVMPAGTGALSGRVITIPNEKRLATLPGILAGQFLQSSVTFIFGIYGLWIVWHKVDELYYWSQYHTYLIVAVVLVLVLSGLFWQKNILEFLRPIKKYPARSWLIIACLSLVRYLVFLLQFILLVSIFNPGIELTLIIGCATWVFAARTFMPKISNLERLGIRALAVVFFMELFNVSPGGVLIAVIALWFINLVIPSVIGLSLIKDMKIRTLWN